MFDFCNWFICGHFNFEQGSYWIRFFKKRGIQLNDRNINPAPFSERNGYKKTLRIGKWAISTLK